MAIREHCYGLYMKFAFFPIHGQLLVTISSNFGCLSPLRMDLTVDILVDSLASQLTLSMFVYLMKFLRVLC